MRPTANIMMTLAFKGDAAWNETRWKNDKFDQLLVDVRGETDADKRKQKGRTEVPLNNFGGAEAPVTLWRDDA